MRMQPHKLQQSPYLATTERSKLLGGSNRQPKKFIGSPPKNIPQQRTPFHRRSASVESVPATAALTPPPARRPHRVSVSPRKIGGRRVSLNISTGSNTYHLFDVIIKENDDWHMTIGTSCDVLILSGRDKLAPKKDQIINRYPNMCQIGRKDTF